MRLCLLPRQMQLRPEMAKPRSLAVHNVCVLLVFLRILTPPASRTLAGPMCWSNCMRSAVGHRVGAQVRDREGRTPLPRTSLVSLDADNPGCWSDGRAELSGPRRGFLCRLRSTTSFPAPLDLRTTCARYSVLSR
jgi:hypothetical protein